MIVLEEELDGPMDIESISWYWLPIEEDFATCEGFELHLGYRTSDQLGDDFESNYNPGSRTLVYSDDSLYVTPGSGNWTTLTLSTPFHYNGSDNLVIEVEWDNGVEDNSYYCGQWEAGSNRCLKSEDGGPALLYEWVTHMIITGTLGLDTGTFGEVKTVLISD